MSNITKKEVLEFEKLNHILKELRSEHGCPWDKEQTPLSLKKHLLEEVYELIDALERADDSAIMEEAGDVYLVITMMISILRETKEDLLWKVLEELNLKLIRRHPHVFGKEKAHNVHEGAAYWQAAKAKEVLDGKPVEAGGSLSRIGRGQPPLEKAFSLQKEAARVGFHWNSVHEVIQKLDEELKELVEAIAISEHSNHIREELGDVLFVAVCLAGSLEIDASEALHEANNKFLRRFGYVQNTLKGKGIELQPSARQEMELAWQMAKKEEKSNPESS